MPAAYETEEYQPYTSVGDGGAGWGRAPPPPPPPKFGKHIFGAIIM